MDIKPENFHCVITASPVTTVVPVYLLKVSPNAPLHPPGFYALIKFFSAAHAAAAQRITDGRPLLDDLPLKVTTFSSSLMTFVCFPGAHLAIFVGFR